VLCVMCYVLCVMCYVLCVMCYVLCVMCYVLCVKQWCRSSGTFLWVRILNNGGIIVEAQFTAFIEPPSAFLILRRRSGIE